MARSIAVARGIRSSGVIASGRSIASGRLVGGGGAFPATGILDPFNRANEGPPPSGSWLTPTGYNGMRVATNVCVPDGLNDSAALWNTLFVADQEVYATISVIPGSLEHVQLLLRNQSGTEITDGYFAEFYKGNPGDNGFVRLYSYIAGVGTQLGADIDLGVEMAVGLVVGIRAVGTTITVWRDGVELGSRTSSVVNGAGYLLLLVGPGSLPSFDNFGGGNV